MVPTGIFPEMGRLFPERKISGFLRHPAFWGPAVRFFCIDVWQRVPVCVFLLLRFGLLVL